jgi:acetyl-CoA carboxylase biotin carboxylase subunit
MIGKLIVHGATRDEAVTRLSRALDGFVVEGVPTTLALHRTIVRHPDFAANRLHTRWLEQVLLADRNLFLE